MSLVISQYPPRDIRVTRVAKTVPFVFFHWTTTGGTSPWLNTSFYNHIIITHRMLNTTLGGWFELELSDSTLAHWTKHHMAGSNIPHGNRNTDYTSLFSFITSRVRVILHIADGHHHIQGILTNG